VSQPFNKTALLMLGGLCLVTALDGCAQTPKNYAPLTTIKADPPQVQAPKATYRIGPGDELEVKFFFAPELNDRMTVRPDGKISIMFAQDIQASGLTAEELAADIRAVLAPHVKQLDLVVIIRSFASQRAYVGGEVSKAGPIALTGNETLLQVLATAGWTTPAGDKKIVVVRRDASGTEKIYPVDIAQLENGTDMAQNIIIQSGDMILVPPSDAIAADRWIDQNIRQMVPVNMGVGAAYNINSNPTQ
jgi:polysaccharide export outer membrane protein